MSRFSIESVFSAVDRVTAPVTRMQNNVGRFARSAETGLRRVNRATSRVVAGFRSASATVLKFGAVGVGGATAAVSVLMREFSKVEDAEAAFTPLLGGAERAKEAVQAINDTAASTPFQFEDLASSVNQLLPVMDGDIENTIKTLRMLGDTAGGNAQKLDSITRGFTKAMLKGKVDMESLNMIAEAGVPIFGDLAEVMGSKVGEDFFDSISAGEVTTTQLVKAFEKLTGEGGKFYQGMEIASKTTSGLWSTLKDNISSTAAELGGVLAPTVKDLIRQATSIAQAVKNWVVANRGLIDSKFLEWVETSKRFLKSLIDMFSFLTRHRETITRVGLTVVSLIATLKILAGVLTVINLILLANPIGLITAAIGLLIVSVASAIIWWDKLKEGFLALPELFMKAWQPVKEFFKGIISYITDLFDRSIKRITGGIDKVKSLASPLTGLVSRLIDSDSERGPVDRRGRPIRPVSPQERTARSIIESKEFSSAEVTIRDQTGRAEVTKGQLSSSIQLLATGAA